MYNYYLGGKDNFPADRAAAERALTVVPYGQEVARANRQFLVRAVTLMARDGIGQFIDLGTGLPTRPNVHEVARSVHPGARVLYVDNDHCKSGCAHTRWGELRQEGVVAHPAQNRTALNSSWCQLDISGRVAATGDCHQAGATFSPSPILSSFTFKAAFPSHFFAGSIFIIYFAKALIISLNSLSKSYVIFASPNPVTSRSFELIRVGVSITPHFSLVLLKIPSQFFELEFRVIFVLAVSHRN